MKPKNKATIKKINSKTSLAPHFLLKDGATQPGHLPPGPSPAHRIEIPFKETAQSFP